MKLDHIMFGASDLDQGIDFIAKLTGETATAGGQHPGSGTHNALLSLGSDQYLEIIAPDPGQDPAGTMAEELRQLGKPGIRTWAAATPDFDLVRQTAELCGYRTYELDMSRDRPDGVLLAWRLLFVTNHPFGLALPFFIDWQQSPHPAKDAPGESRLDQFEVSCPDAEDLGAFCRQINLDVVVKKGDTGFTALVQSPAGEVELT